MKCVVAISIALLAVGCAAHARESHPRGAVQLDPSIVPAPRSMRVLRGVYRVPFPITISARTAGERSAAGFLAAFLQNASIATTVRDANSAPIRIRALLAPRSSDGDEGYEVRVGPSGVVVDAKTGAGLYYGVQTLEQLAVRRSGGLVFPYVLISDRPEYRWRGIHLDVSRHFFTAEVVERYIDVAAHYKLNVFHWHLTDSEGWRLPIAAYPQLTARGRSYTPAQVREILAYAQSRHIVVVPEIDVPAHAAAAIAAYPWLGCGRGGDVLCASRSAFHFLDTVFAAVAQTFPSPYVDAGGDETTRDAAFMPHIERTLHAYGKRLVGWDAIATSGVSRRAVVMSWRGERPGLAAAREGFDTVLSPDGPLYFDALQGDRDQEPRATAHTSTLEEVYDYSPTLDGMDHATREHVLGVEGALWTTYIRTPDALFYMLLPRELALAETAWTPRSKKSWPSFLARLPAQLAWLHARGYPFRIPAPLFEVRGGHIAFTALAHDMEGAAGFTDAAQVTVHLRDPAAAVVRYTEDGSAPTAASSRYVGPFLVALDRPRVLRAVAFAYGRTSTVTTCVLRHLSTPLRYGSSTWAGLVSP